MPIAILEPVSPVSTPQLRVRTGNGSRQRVADSGVDKRIEASATAILESHPHFRGRTDWVKCRCRDQCLQLRGRVPSFYLKQLAQEAVKRIGNDIQIENLIVVASPDGEVCRGELSLSERQDYFPNTMDRRVS